MTGEELNQTASSQPESAPSSAEGTNGSGKPSEPVATGTMTPSQDRDYYNSKQQLAQQRREFEAEKTAWEQQRMQSGQGNSQGFQQPNSQNFQQPMQNNQPQMIFPPNYAALVQELGVDGANRIVETINSTAQPFNQMLQQTHNELTQLKIATIETNLKNQAIEKYGPEEWKQHGTKVMEIIKQYGTPIDLAWNAVKGPASVQAATDQAYQKQQEKQAANVGQNNFQPANSSGPVINSVRDAFEAAKREAGI